MLTSEQNKKISELTAIGLPPGQIRNHFDINMLPDHLCNLRRKQIEEKFLDETQNLYDFTQKIKNNYDII